MIADDDDSVDVPKQTARHGSSKKYYGKTGFCVSRVHQLLSLARCNFSYRCKYTHYGYLCRLLLFRILWLKSIVLGPNFRHL